MQLLPVLKMQLDHLVDLKKIGEQLASLMKCKQVYAFFGKLSKIHRDYAEIPIFGNSATMVCVSHDMLKNDYTT